MLDQRIIPKGLNIDDPVRKCREQETANAVIIAMKKKNVKKDLLKLGKAENREKAKEQGYYDGRYRSRVVPDKKKKANKEAARKKENEPDE